MEKTIQKYVKQWEKRCYKNGLPDDAPKEIFTKVPSYKKIALAILDNDHALESLGFSSNNKTAYNALKKIELQNRIKNYKRT